MRDVAGVGRRDDLARTMRQGRMAQGSRKNGGSRQLALLLEEHTRALRACRRCAFADPAVLPVTSGARTPLAMLVGQAPGKTEVVDRRPFAGRAGRTLFRWFAEAGISEDVARERIYIAAITRCYPGASPSGRGDRVPSPAQIAACSSWLDAELEIVSPRVLIPVGRLAIERFLGPRPLDEQVGRAHVLENVPGQPAAIPLPHPSGASSWIHGPGHMDLVRESLRLIRQLLPELVLESARTRSVA
ncbi:MAG TPA: uracil-DNA glycosylase family protein [Gemmatimonadaceae bacterium]|jgi:uracil-DNA glycosylase|nr:uracil-DNA glycosylase family protein [Gemmatimonadaceae bacterium]